MNWAAETETLAGGRGRRTTVLRNGEPVTYGETLHDWQHDADFRTWFNAQLADTPFTAFAWETPPVTTATLGRAFAFVILDRPGLDLPADATAFSAHLDAADAVAVFPNLGHDALLVAPCAQAAPPVYGHLASFVRGAPGAQRNALWAAVGNTMAERVGERPVWLSTAGGGVPWLHVRLDDHPKYYGYAPYRAAPG